LLSLLQLTSVDDTVGCVIRCPRVVDIYIADDGVVVDVGAYVGVGIVVVVGTYVDVVDIGGAGIGVVYGIFGDDAVDTGYDD